MNLIEINLKYYLIFIILFLKIKYYFFKFNYMQIIYTI